MNDFKPGAYYEDCSFHPCLCISVDYDDRSISGISLVDGTERSCDLDQCGVRALTLEEALLWKREGPQELEHEWVPLPDNQWWWPKPIEGVNPSDCLTHLFWFSLNFLRTNTEELVGKSIRGWYNPSGQFDSTAIAPAAWVQYQVTGLNRVKATVRVDAIKEGRLWPITKISVQLENSEPVVFTGEQVRGCGRAG